ncbi:diadenosine tetraphosphatase [Eikenella sp. S3360]|uniref:Diadenosine tetraphosphatase n=1 Tax=Eikenella glucosivorans TaxID=2766967 RepID=A0ABS0N9S3_9NEIS|nr:HI_0552 family protein [Eikenella glucosivorans]MBH5329061.1 diadenosine tetraphosphatase [Eikenella glucosivorans]
MLTPQSCDLFQRPFFQFAQIRQYQPETEAQTKAEYKAAWQMWRALIFQVASGLGAGFAPPHIERWCNGWQVRAHFFAYFKYAAHADTAVILSLLLNRRRLTASLEWHEYRAAKSTLPLACYQQALAGFPRHEFADFQIWHGRDSEYADYPAVSSAPAATFALQDAADFLCLGRHLERDELEQADSAAWMAESIRRLLPVYEACHNVRL